MADLLPYNATPQERALSEAAARVGEVPVPIRDIWNASTCPPQLLAWLAWAFSVDQWDSTWTEAQQREFIKQSVEVHRYKGTIGAVEDALAALGIQAHVQEWFNQEPAGDPYTFSVELTADQTGISQADHAAIVEVIDRTKNLRSHMTEIALTVRSDAGPQVAMAAGVGHDICVSNFVPAVAVLNETAIII